MQEIFDIVGGGTPPTAVAEYWQGDIPWITSADIDDRHKVTPRRSISREAIENSATNLVPAGSVIVVTRVGLGKVGIAESPLCFSQDSQALIFRRELLHPRYVLLYMGTAVTVFKWTGRGTTISGVTKKQLANLKFLLPPLPEQKRIVEEIEKQFTRLEAGVAGLKRIQANLKRYRAAVLKAAVEGHLVPTEAELARRDGRSYEPASELLKRILAERRARWEGDQLAKFRACGKLPKDDKWKEKYQEPAGPGTANLPILPEGWIWTRLDQSLIRLRNGISRKPDSEAGIPILRISAVRPLRVDMSDVRFLKGKFDDYADYIVKEGDLLFTRYNGNPALTGVCGVVRNIPRTTVHPDKLIRATVAEGLCLPPFLEVVLNVGPSRDFIASRVRTTAGQAGVSGGDLRSVPVPLAPNAEQQRIVAEAERRLSVIDELELQAGANLKRAERLRQAILKRAFEGKLVPQDQDDEPASVLLERIRTERAARQNSINAKRKAKKARAT